MRFRSELTVIRTKLLAPKLRPQTIERKAVLQRLSSNLQKKLVLVIAPAGFGKSTTLGLWSQKLTQDNRYVAWYTATEADNEAETFLRYFVTALSDVLGEIYDEIIARLEGAYVDDISAFLGDIANGLSQFPCDCFLFIDDFHFLEKKEILDFFDLLLHLSPPNFHVVLSTRHAPAFSLVSLKVKNEIVEVSSEDLRLDRDETGRFMETVLERKLEAEQIADIESRCEGWAAALQLASLSIKKNKGDLLLANLSGDSGAAAEYLANSVFDELEENVQMFLLVSSVLDRLNADLCDFVLKRNDSKVILDQLDNDNFFISSLDDKEKWYRCHGLLRDFLFDRLKEMSVIDINELHGNASIWFEKNEYYVEAVSYAIKADGVNRAAKLIESLALTEFNLARISLVASWINQLPVSTQLMRPNLIIFNAVALLHMYKVSDAFAALKILQKNLSRYPKELQENLKNKILTLRNCINMAVDRVSEDIDLLPDIGEPIKHFMDCVISNARAYTHFALGDAERSKEMLEAAWQKNSEQPDQTGLGLTFSDTFASIVEYSHGNLYLAKKALHRSESIRDPSEQSDIQKATKSVCLSAITYEMGQLEGGLEDLTKNISRIEQVSHISHIQLGYVTMVRLTAREIGTESALTMLDRLQGLFATGYTSDYHDILIGYHRFKILHRAGREGEAFGVAAGFSVLPSNTSFDPPRIWFREQAYKLLLQARLLQATREHEAATQILAFVKAYCTDHGYELLALEASILLSFSLWNQGKNEKAIDTLKLSCQVASENQILELFREEAANLRPILVSLQDTIGEANSQFALFLRNIIDDSQGNRPPKTSSRSVKVPVLVEAPSHRELEVLGLMAKGKTNTQIANQLSISENTVKWHSRNLFGKLSVKNRTEAVITAQNLKLLT